MKDNKGEKKSRNAYDRSHAVKKCANLAEKWENAIILSKS